MKRFSIIFVVAVFLAFVVGAACAKGAEIGGFPPRPRLAYSSEEIVALRSDPGQEAEKTSILARGEKLLLEPIVIPTDPAGGQWPFYYACPDDATRLRAKSPEEHECPKCGKVYRDERTVAAYRTSLYYEADDRMYRLALAYAVSEEDRFAEPVRRAFLELVDLYPKLQRHDRWGRKGLLAVVGGRRFCQHLEEATSAIKLAKAYDLCCASSVFSDADRATIEKNLLESIVNEIHSFGRFVGGKNNHQTWFNAAFANVGVATGNRSLIDRALDGPKGLRWQLRESVTNDGIWYEGTISYHFYALHAVIETLRALKRIGIDLSDNARLKSLWLGPLHLAWPDGSMPAINDGDPYRLTSQRNQYRFALDYFNDPIFASLAGETAEDGKPLATIEADSVNLSDIGLAILRRRSEADAAALFFDYGIHGGHHGHPDKMNIIFFCLGREILLDPGRISYSVSEYESWGRTTVAHNTVVMDRKNQSPATGKLLFFETTEEWTACFGTCETAYPDGELRRFLCMTDSMLIDVFWVATRPGMIKGRRNATWDWIVHARGDLVTDLSRNPVAAALGADAGYQHLESVQVVSSEGCMRFDSVQPDGRVLRIHLVPGVGSVYTGLGIGTAKSERVPFILQRLEDRSESLFVAVYDFGNDASKIESVKRLDVLGPDGKSATDAAAVEIAGTRWRLRVAMNLDVGESERRVGDTPFGRLLFQRLPDGSEP